jgi:hypothetical protein
LGSHLQTREPALCLKATFRQRTIPNGAENGQNNQTIFRAARVHLFGRDARSLQRRTNRDTSPRFAAPIRSVHGSLRAPYRCKEHDKNKKKIESVSGPDSDTVSPPTLCHLWCSIRRRGGASRDRGRRDPNREPCGRKKNKIVSVAPTANAHAQQTVCCRPAFEECRGIFDQRLHRFQQRRPHRETPIQTQRVDYHSSTAQPSSSHKYHAFDAVIWVPHHGVHFGVDVTSAVIGSQSLNDQAATSAVTGRQQSTLQLTQT